MDKKRLEIIIAALLVVVLVLVFSRSLVRIRKKVFPAKAGTEMMPVKKIEPLFTKKEGPDREGSGKKDLSWGRDPFSMHEITPASIDTAASLKLMGITAGEGTKPKAIINDKIVSIGSKIGRFKVLTILPDRVVVSDGEKNYELMLQ